MVVIRVENLVLPLQVVLERSQDDVLLEGVDRELVGYLPELLLLLGALQLHLKGDHEVTEFDTNV